jgi:wobble nucleotide-excising tRNase
MWTHYNISSTVQPIEFKGLKGIKMLQRIKLLQGIGNFSSTRPSRISLSEVTVLYGENRYGKSTLCDVFHSLATDDPSPIISRQTIPLDATKPQTVEFGFVNAARDNVVAKFENGTWGVKNPDCCKLYVFDHSFIHRNVITGQKPERANSESMTSFILGEANTALFQALARMKANLTTERRDLTVIEQQFSSNYIPNIPQYVGSALPPQSQQQLQDSKAALESSKQLLMQTVQNLDVIKQRNILSAFAAQVNFVSKFESINSVLASSLQNVHQGSLNILQSHMADHVNNAVTFKGWASQGASHIKDDCPFCGQGLSNDAVNLIGAYQQAFNAEFDNFNNQTRHTLNSLRQPFTLSYTREQLVQHHRANRGVFEQYLEPQVTGNATLSPLSAQLEEKHTALLLQFDALSGNCQVANDFWLPRLEQKFATPYEQAQGISFAHLNAATIAFNQALLRYSEVAGHINVIFNGFKDSLDVVQLNAQIAELNRQHGVLQGSLNRIALEPLCNTYRQKLAQVTALETAYTTQKSQLEQSQSSYLDTYFSSINSLFKELGSDKFEIIKLQNGRGKQVVYDLKVKFNDEDIPTNKINTIFSESDRRALALCIFLAKIMTLPAEEKAKAILVLDDPVTSFDNERITLILNKLDEVQRTIKQLIITTHYKGMAAKAAKKFKRCVTTVKLVNDVDTCTIQEVDADAMMATDHDMAFDKIKAFVDRVTNDDILTTLRPFFEHEIRHRYKKQLQDLNVVKEDLSVCTRTLRDNRMMSVALEARISAIRDSLNTPMHELGDSGIDNTRSLAASILDVIYVGINANPAH